MAFRRSISIDICCFFSLSLSLCIDLHLRLVRLTFFPPFLFRFYYIVCSSAGETFAPNAQEQLGFPLHPISGVRVCVCVYAYIHVHEMRKNNWVSLSIQYLVCMYIFTRIYIHTHTHT
jgi:hypothetical protein